MKVKSSPSSDGSTPNYSEIQFVNFALQEHVPGSSSPSGKESSNLDSGFGIQLDDHLFPYEGCSISRADFLWGVYGYRLQTQIAHEAYKEADRNGLKSIPLHATYRVNRFDEGRHSMNRDGVRNSGFLHVERVRADFRREIESRLLAVATEKYAGVETGANAKKPLWHLLLDFPMLVKDLFNLEPSVNVIAHPVRPTWHSKLSAVYVCTMRRLPDRVDAKVQYMPGVPVHF